MRIDRSAPAARTGAPRPHGTLRALGAMAAAGVAFALVPACDTGPRTGGEGQAAPAETLIERTARARVSRLWFAGDGRPRTRATLRIPRNARPRSLACVVIAGGHEHGWMTAEYLEAGPGVAVLSVDYPYEGPRRSIPRDRIAEVVPKIWNATRAMAPLLREAGAYAARRPEIDSTRILIVGASLGVPFALKAAAEDTRFAGVALLYGAADLGAWAERNIKGIPDWTRPLVRGLTRVLFHDLEPERLIPRISPRPVLVVSGRNDEMIPEDLARRLYEAAGEPREQVWLDTRHMHPDDADLTWRLMRIAFEWARKHEFVQAPTRRLSTRRDRIMFRPDDDRAAQRPARNNAAPRGPGLAPAASSATQLALAGSRRLGGRGRAGRGGRDVLGDDPSPAVRDPGP